jgi:hypothetical protein
MPKKRPKDLLLWLTLIVMVLGLISAFYIPEIRAFLGLKEADAPTNIGISSGPNSPIIQDNKGPVTTNPGEAPKNTDEQKDKQGDKK